MSETKSSRYIIGIDLGTTNSTIAYVDTTEENPQSRTLTIPQVIAPGETQELNTLPSFLYLPEEGTVAAGALNLPWTNGNADCTVGSYARKLSSSLPGKVVSSAKSWLCNEQIDRTDSNLPFGVDEDQRKVSAIEATALYLQHIAYAWDSQMASENEALRIGNQQVVLTVPASFDAIARELTVMAADEAGLNVSLLEEPQAAFYSWLNEHEDTWRDSLVAGQSILVCDIGGGTSDFSLIGVNDEDGDLTLQRLAVGEHILLGGDNMDMTLAYVVQKKLGKRLNPKQMTALIHACRQAKENLCADPNAESEKITILGSGSSLIGGTLSTELTREEVFQFILNGFTPNCSLDDHAQKQTRAGLRSFGLNYESDTALTRHLAEFLSKNSPKSPSGGTQLPSAVLFNGGVSKADLLRDRIIDNINDWAGHETEVLTGTNPDLAVACGAAWFGYVKRGNSIRIKSGSMFSYYIGIESSMPAVPGFPPPTDAVCILPCGAEDGTEFDIPIQHIGLLVGEKSRFRFFASKDHPDHEIGTVVDDFSIDELTELPALNSHLSDDEDSNGAIIPIQLKSVLTDIGTVQTWCHESQGIRKWRLEFDLHDEE